MQRARKIQTRQILIGSVFDGLVCFALSSDMFVALCSSESLLCDTTFEQRKFTRLFACIP